MPSRSSVYFYLAVVLVATLLVAGAVHKHNQHESPQTPTPAHSK